MTQLAHATYRDAWAGPVAVALVAFRTKRRGQPVTRYRWIRRDGQSLGIWRSPFATIRRGVTAARDHALFSDIREAGQ